MTSGRLLLLLAVAVIALAQARASPLDADSCTELEVERALLRLAGVEADMANGPEWAKANLAPLRIEEIGRLIEVEEQLLFRCRDAAAPDAKAEAPATKKETQAEKKAAAKQARQPASSRRKQGRGTAKTKPAAKAAE